jgi:cobalamin biosynthetic protein CobC
MRMKHGGDITQAMAQFGGTRESWLDFSTGINPRAWPIRHDLPDPIWQHLPTKADEIALLDAARAAYRVPNDITVVAAPGTQALIQWLPRLAVDGPAAIVTPTYSEHAASWRESGHKVIAIKSIDAIPEQARHIVLVNPNNPDGRIVDLAALARTASIVAKRDGWLIIDEAFADVVPAISAVGLCARYPVVILRSFGKFYGLAGLRLGFALASQPIANQIKKALGPWACSGPALMIGAAALRDDTWANATRAWLTQQADALDDVLQQAGFTTAGGTSLYRLVRHRNALAIHEQLAVQHIWCRRFDWDKSVLRFGPAKDEASLARLAAALAHRSSPVQGTITASR